MLFFFASSYNYHNIDFYKYCILLLVYMDSVHTAIVTYIQYIYTDVV